MKYAIILLGILVLALAACAPTEVVEDKAGDAIEDKDDDAVKAGDVMEDKDGDAIMVGDAMEDKAGDAMEVSVSGITADVRIYTVMTKGDIIEFFWEVKTSEDTTILHTAVHFSTKSHPGSLGTDINPANSGYESLTSDYASGSFTVPKSFTASIIPPSDPFYYRVHAIVDGKNYWSEELRKFK